MLSEETLNKLTDIYMNLTCNYDKCDYMLVKCTPGEYVFRHVDETTDDKDITIYFSSWATERSYSPEEVWDKLSNDVPYVEYLYESGNSSPKSIQLVINKIFYPVNLSKSQLGLSLEALDKIVEDYQLAYVEDAWNATRNTICTSEDDLD